MAWCRSEIETKLHDLKADKRKLLNERNLLQKRSSEYRLRSRKLQFDADMIEIVEIDHVLIDVDREIAKLENDLKRSIFSKKPT